MIKVGITGGIGSGKSTIARVFQVLGAPLFKADEEAKKALNEDPELRNAIRAQFGEHIYGAEGVDRKALAEQVFEDPDRLKRLNELVHPKVRERFESWCQTHRSAPYVLEEAAILIESGGHRMLDFIILVTAPEKLRIQRVMERDGVSEAEVRRRMERQWSDETKRPYADLVLPNDDSELLVPRVLEKDKEWKGSRAK